LDFVREAFSIANSTGLNSGVTDLLDTCKHYQLPTAAYRQLGAGGALRMVPDPSQNLVFDAFGRDQDLPDRRTTDKLGGHLDAAEVASVSHSSRIGRNKRTPDMAHIYLSQTHDTPIAALQPLLSIIQTSEELGLWNVFRQCSVKLSHVLTQIDREVQVDFAHPSQTKSGKEGDGSLMVIAMKEIQGIWDQVCRSRQ
jgi:hypothetical protein